MNFFLILTPSLTFNLSPSEIFPYALLIFLPMVIFDFFVFAFLLLNIGLLCCIIISQFDLFGFVTSYIAFLNSSIPFFIKKEYLYSDKIENVLQKYIILILFLCTIQYFGVFDNYSNIWSNIIPRGSLGNLSDERGVTGLSTEPSRSGYEFFSVVYTLIIVHIIKGNFKSSSLLILSSLFFLFLNKSLTILILFAIGFLFIFLKSNINKLFYLVVAVFLLFVINTVPNDGRISDFFRLFIDFDFYNIIDFIYIQSFHRLPTIAKSFDFIFSNNILGSGLGNWFFAQSLSDFPSDHIERVPYFIEFMLELGLIPFILFFYYILRRLNISQDIVYLPYLLALFIVSDPGSPVIPFCLTYLSIHLNRKNYA